MTSPSRRRRDKSASRKRTTEERLRRQADVEERERRERAQAKRSSFYHLTRGDCLMIRRAIKKRWPVDLETANRIMEVDLFRPIHDPNRNDRLILAIGRTVLTAVQEDLKDKIRDDRQRLREQRKQAREKAKQDLARRVVIVEPKPKARIDQSPERKVSEVNQSQFSDTFTKDRETMSYFRSNTSDRESAAVAPPPPPPQWQNGFLLHPAGDVQNGPRRSVHWRFEYLNERHPPVTPDFIETETFDDLLGERVNPVTHETVLHVLQKHTRKIAVCQEWPHPMKPSEKVRHYKWFNGYASDVSQFPPEIVRRMLLMICGYGEGDPAPKEVEF